MEIEFINKRITDVKEFLVSQGYSVVIMAVENEKSKDDQGNDGHRTIWSIDNTGMNDTSSESLRDLFVETFKQIFGR